ncbi:uncharacterized protein LOC143192391 [Rhynchophorus ferrugineus]|uniref:uncharacterized protein LOC143192391 n=1 Tax=Rhynchophorus ferrugineus TaxID=354439 RepID=UPI003FCE197D
MFQIYLVVSAILLPTGLIGIAYVVYWGKLTQNPIKWNKLCNGISTLLLGILYLYSGIALSRGYDHVIYENNIDDLAIINDTLAADSYISFYPESENEAEDTRNNKINFLQRYNELVQMSINNKTKNISKEISQRRSRRLTSEKQTLTMEEQNCFMKIFLYQALLVYSFISCIVSLIYVCQTCKTDLASSIPELSVKQTGVAKGLTTKSKQTTLYNCVATIVLPQIFVSILYGIMNTSDYQPEITLNNFNPDMFNFNVTRPDNLINDVLEQSNGTHHNETQLILHRIYGIIDKFKQNKNDHDLAKAHYFLMKHFVDKAVRRSSVTCFKDNPYLKCFHLIVFVFLFFLVVYYSKLKQIRASDNPDLNKCILAFVCFWIPCVLDILVKMFLMEREADVTSKILLMLGTMNRLFFNFRDVANCKRISNQVQTVQPVVNDCP